MEKEKLEQAIEMIKCFILDCNEDLEELSRRGLGTSFKEGEIIGFKKSLWVLDWFFNIK